MNEFYKDYICERRLKELDPDLHQRFKDSVFVMTKLLTQYQTLFPTFTDHTVLHSMEVLHFCNQLMGSQANKLNDDEIYILLMSCYLHDSGMCISDKDFEIFAKELGLSNCSDGDNSLDKADCVRKFHHEFSGKYIQKYSDIFDIPTKKHTFAIMQVSRGHRKTDLYNNEEYPTNFTLDNKNNVCITYLAALVRLADELDITKWRNSSLLFDISSYTKEIDIREFEKHEAVKSIIFEKDKFVVMVDAPNENVYNNLLDATEKMQETLEYSYKVVEERTPFKITQREIVLKSL